jgi:hypothetical protein
MKKFSRKSVRRFLKLWRQVRAASAEFHQTLTFAVPEFDLGAAKGRLSKLLDNIHHRFTVASLYVAGLHRSGAIHFHVVFLFFSPVSAEESEQFESAVWDAWNGLNMGKCHRNANEFRRADFHNRLKAIEYFLKDAPVEEKRWWGSRNNALIRDNSRAVTRAEIDETILFPCNRGNNAKEAL